MKNLTIHDREFLIECLGKGTPLPDDFKEKLFPTTHKEYELRYAGKMRKEDLLADQDGTFAVPLQVEKIYNGDREKYKDGWRNMIVFGDNLQFLKTCYANKDELIRNKVKGKVKLIYIDPPFGTGDEYDGNKGQSGYTAKTKGAEFVEFLRRRLILAREILADDGGIFVRQDYHFGHYTKLVLDEVFGKENFQNEIIINRFKRQLKNLTRYNHAVDSLFYYSKSDSHTFYEIQRERLDTFTGEKSEPVWRGMSSPGLRNPPERKIFGKIMYPPKGRHWTFKQTTLDDMIKAKRIRINDKIQYTDINGNKVRGLPEYLQSELVPVDNLWTDLKGYVFNASYPTENPEELIQRVILSTTKENDLVMDFFGGSGATASTAEKLNRRWITCDIGKFSFYTMQKRFLTIEDSKDLIDPDKKYKKKAKTFVSVNTGIYDLKKMQELNQDKYIEFVLQLFEVTSMPKTIKGIKLHGERKDGYSVLVWDYWNHKDSAVDTFFLEQLHQNIGKRISKRLYIIAPANAVQFISDFHEIDDVRYYFLKIPYQIIRELHPKSFAKFRQPSSKSKINDLDNAIGFHFMLQPEVQSEFKNGKLVIKKFLSNFREEETDRQLPNFESLSMVIIDETFNGKDFMMSQSLFKEDIEDKNGTLQIPLGKTGKEICVIYIDLYGNEFKETIKVK